MRGIRGKFLGVVFDDFFRGLLRRLLHFWDSLRKLNLCIVLILISDEFSQNRTHAREAVFSGLLSIQIERCSTVAEGFFGQQRSSIR